jgi:hypothetical protein
MSESGRVSRVSPVQTAIHTHASILAMQGVPMAVIARQLGHSDTRMTERHYAHLAPNCVADTIRASFPRLGGVEAPTVVPIRRARMINCRDVQEPLPGCAPLASAIASP